MAAARRDRQAVTMCAPSRNSAFYQDFLQLEEQANPEDTIWVITDNLSSHDSKGTWAWLQDPPHPARLHPQARLLAEPARRLVADLPAPGAGRTVLRRPRDKRIGRPKSLSLKEAIMVTLLYKRQNLIEEVIADLFGVAQATVSEIITNFTPLVAQATEKFRPGAEEAKQMTRGRMALVDGTLWPCWSWEAAPEMWAGKYKTTGHGSLIIGDEFGT
jgi:hypothetical protein